eukprot:852988-Rhodomonas_salina.1
MIVIHKSLFAMLYLHSDKTATTIKDILEKAFAKAGNRLRILRSDGAGEYEEDSQYVASNHQDTSPSNFPIEFWGLAALWIVEGYNVLPHSSLNNNIPYELHTVQLFIVGKNTLTITNYLPAVNQAYLLDLQLQKTKAWLAYCPSLNKIFASRDVQFDETFFPLRVHDQLVFGKYNHKLVKEMRASNHLVTLDQQGAALQSSDLWDSAQSELLLHQHFCTSAVNPVPITAFRDRDTSPLPESMASSGALTSNNPSGSQQLGESVSAGALAHPETASQSAGMPSRSGPTTSSATSAPSVHWHDETEATSTSHSTS